MKKYTREETTAQLVEWGNASFGVPVEQVVEDLYATAHRLATTVVALYDDIGDLLARINRDGGGREAELGTEAAMREADETVARLYAEFEDLSSGRGRERARLLEWLRLIETSTADADTLRMMAYRAGMGNELHDTETKDT